MEGISPVGTWAKRLQNLPKRPCFLDVVGERSWILALMCWGLVGKYLLSRVIFHKSSENESQRSSDDMEIGEFLIKAQEKKLLSVSLPYLPRCLYLLKETNYPGQVTLYNLARKYSADKIFPTNNRWQIMATFFS